MGDTKAGGNAGATGETNASGEAPTSDLAPAGPSAEGAAGAPRVQLARGQAGASAQPAGPAAGSPPPAGGVSAQADARSGAHESRDRAIAGGAASGEVNPASSAGEGIDAASAAVDSLLAAEALDAPPPQASLSSGPAVNLQDVIDAARATIEMAARQGVSQARIALHPQELGDIRIHLSQNADGLLARVTADSPAAAQALAEGRAELHQSLSSLGVSLLRLDIGSSGQSNPQDRDGRSAAGAGEPSVVATTDVPIDEESVESLDGSAAPQGAAVALDGGGLVNVLA